MPLTEQPLIYDLIRTDIGYVPTNRKQSFRDADGSILSPGAGFDLAPMAKRPGVGNGVQFTDLTLDGTMNPKTVYYYFAREIGNRMDMSDPSLIFGPVALVNLTPPAPPTLRNVRTVPYDPRPVPQPRCASRSSPPVTEWSHSPGPHPQDHGPVLALSARTMQLVKVVDVASLVVSADGTVTAADDFRSDPLPPYGEPLFYRLAWVREVAYEDAGHAPRVASVPSSRRVSASPASST